MKKIISQICGGGAKSLKYLLAGALAFALAETAQAANKYWVGSGDPSIWGEPSSWYNSSAPADSDYVYFRSSVHAINCNTVTFRAAHNYTGTKLIFDNGSSEENPFVFIADQNDDHGYSCQNDVFLGYHGSTYGDGWLKILGGKYSINYIQIGRDANNLDSAGHLVLDATDHAVNFTCTADNYGFKLHHGTVVTTNATVTVPVFYVGDKTNSRALIDTTDGSWTVNKSKNLELASGQGATAAIVNRGCTWTFQYDVHVAPGASSIGSFTNVSGKLTMPTGRYFQIAYGASSTGTVEKQGGGWTCGTIQIAGNDNAVGTFRHSGGWLTTAGYGLCIGCKTSSTSLRGTFELTGGAVTNNAGNVIIGDNGDVGSLATLHVTGGELYVKTGNLRVGGNMAGVLEMDGGDVVAPNGVVFCNSSTCTSGKDGLLNLNGGTLAANTVNYGSGSAAATFKFNGGTLKALQAGTLISQHNNLTVNVDAGGAIIDTDSKAVSIASPLNAATGVAGDLTVTGGGTLTASGDLTGAFTVGENTTLHYFDQDGTVANYAISTINIAPGATLYLDADATGCDTFGAATTNITATSANKATINLVFASSVPAGTSYTLFETVDGSEFDVKPMLGALELPHETSVVNGKLTLAITAEDYTWNGSQTNWGDADAWTKGGADLAWNDGNNAIFDTAGREAALSAPASASEVRFTANATISGTAALSASKIDVSSGAMATISAPFGSAVQKTGAGTLALAGSAANAYDLTLAEGTLALGGTASLDWSKFTFGTDPLKPVTLDVGANASLTGNSNMNLGTVAGVTQTLVKEGGDWTVTGNFLLCRDVADTTANLVHNGGTLTVGGYFSVGDCADATFSSLEINGGTVNSTHSGSYATIGATCDATGIVRNGGVFNVSGNLLVGNHAAGTLTIDDGGTVNTSDIIFHYNNDGGASLVNLKAGGVLSPYRIYYRTNGNNEDCTFKFDGGTVKCKYATLVSAHDRLFVKVASTGGIIDLQGKTVAIEEPLLEDAESTGGGMTFKGGGVVTLASGNTYTGTTTVEVGTTVHVAAPAEIGGGIAVTVPETAPADGVYKLVVVDGAGTFSDAVLTGVVAPANARLRLSGDNKSILCIYGNPPNTWVGGASGSLNDNANWSLDTVPAVGESCVIGNPAAANLTNPSGSAFAPSVITFPADTALVTISGEGVIPGITAITNNASLHHVFNCPVVCADNITPDITRGSGNYMTFAGGITMFNAPKTGSSTVDYWSGNVAVTTESAQEYKLGGNYGQLVAGTTFSFDNGMIDHMYIEPGATTVVNRLVYNGCVRSSTANNKTAKFNYVFDNGNGVIRAKEIKATGDAVLFHSWAGGDQQCGTIIAEKLTSATTAMTGGGGWDWPLFFLNGGQTTGSGFADNASNGEGVWVIGRGGLSLGSDAIAQSFYGVHLGKTLGNGRPAATLHSYEDWALDVHPRGASQASLEISSGHGELLVIDTSHYAVGDPVLDAATSHTVTLNGKVQGGGAMRVEGNGKVIFANANNAFSGGLTVTNTATVSVKAGCKPGAGAVTLATGTTLEVAESGTATVGGNLTLDDGATLAFNFTQKATAPTLALASGKTVSVAENGKVNVKVSGSRPRTGRYQLTSGCSFTSAQLEGDSQDFPKGGTLEVESGDIYLNVVHGMSILIK